MKKTIAGFTLIEQLVVLVVIGILVAFAIAGLLGQAEKALYVQVESDLYYIALSIRDYHQATGQYPADQNPNEPPIPGEFFPVKPNTPFNGVSQYDYDYFEFDECIVKVSNTGRNNRRDDLFREAGRIGVVEVTGDDHAITIDRGDCLDN